MLQRQRPSGGSTHGFLTPTRRASKISLATASMGSSGSSPSPRLHRFLDASVSMAAAQLQSEETVHASFSHPTGLGQAHPRRQAQAAGTSESASPWTQARRQMGRIERKRTASDAII